MKKASNFFVVLLKVVIATVAAILKATWLVVSAGIRCWWLMLPLVGVGSWIYHNKIQPSLDAWRHHGAVLDRSILRPDQYDLMLRTTASLHQKHFGALILWSLVLLGTVAALTTLILWFDARKRRTANPAVPPETQASAGLYEVLDTLSEDRTRRNYEDALVEIRQSYGHLDAQCDCDKYALATMPPAPWRITFREGRPYGIQVDRDYLEANHQGLTEKLLVAALCKGGAPHLWRHPMGYSLVQYDKEEGTVTIRLPVKPRAPRRRNGSTDQRAPAPDQSQEFVLTID